MVKNNIGDAVANSMQNIVESDEYYRLFNTASKACCDCEKKCTKKCACEGDCKKSCKLCKAMGKFGEAPCCTCTGKCAKNCSCKGKCAKGCDCHKNHTDNSDCSMCGDNCSKTSVLEMADTLLSLSYLQDELGLSKSSNMTMQALASMLAEANEDKNEVEMLPYLEPSATMNDEEPLELARLEEEEIDDPAQVEWWLEEGKRKAPPLDTKTVDEVLHREPLSPSKKNLEPRNFVSLEGVNDEDIPLEDIDLSPGNPTINWEDAYKQEQIDMNKDYGTEGAPGGWELPAHLWPKTPKHLQNEDTDIDVDVTDLDNLAFQELDEWLTKEAGPYSGRDLEDLLDEEVGNSIDEEDEYFAPKKHRKITEEDLFGAGDDLFDADDLDLENLLMEHEDMNHHEHSDLLEPELESPDLSLADDHDFEDE